MTNEKQDENKTVVEEKTPNNIEIISQLKWDKLDLPVELIIIKLQFVALAIFFLLLLIPIVFALTYFMSGMTIALGVIIAVGYLFIFLLMILAYIESTSIEYIAESGKIYKLENKIVGGLQGKVVVRRGYFAKRITNLTMNEFDRVTVLQSLIGKWLNYGTVVLEQVDTLQHTEDIRLNYVKNPRHAAEIVQNLIDLEKNTLPVLTQGLSVS